MRRESVINYCSRQIIINDEVIVNFDVKPCVYKTEPCKLTLKARSETIVNVTTNYKVLGLLDKTHLSPGIFLAASLTKGENGVCPSVVNTTEQDQTVVLPRVYLEGLDWGESSLTFAFSAVAGSDSRLNSLRKQLRLHNLNVEERVSIVEIYEEYNDIFLLPNDKLTCTSNIEHAMPTPNVDPHRAINVRPFRIPRIHRGEVQRQTEQMLADGVIQHSTSPWNSPILFVPKKQTPLGRQNLGS